MRIMALLDTDTTLEGKSMLKYIAKLLMQMLAQRDYGEQEVMFQLLGYNL